MKNFQKNFLIRHLTVAAAMILLAACGQAIPASERNADGTFNNSLSPTQIASADGEYNCPSSANAVPSEDQNFDGTQHYTVCPSGNSALKSLVKGWSSSSALVCVYPINFVSNTQFSFRPDSYGLPMFGCYNAATAPNHRKEISFGNTAYNGVIIVDQTQQLAMSRCLTMPGAPCPVRSMARIR